MRKKIILFIFNLILSFAFLDNLSAKEVKICKYELASPKTQVIVQIGSDGKVVSDPEYDRELGSNTDNRALSMGNKDVAANFDLAGYYKKNKKCPPILLISDSGTGRHVYLTDEEHKAKVKSAIKKHYSNLKEIVELNQTGTEAQKEDEQDWKETLSSSCMSLETEPECKQGYTKGNADAEIKFSCLWVKNEFDTDGYCNVDKLVYVKCGDSFDIPHEAPKIISFVVYLLKIGTPIILIFFSIIPLVKALANSKEDELKKAQKVLIKKIIAAALVFFIISIVQFVIMKVADSSETDNISDCFDCFLNNNCESTAYYKTNVGGTYLCKDFSSGKVDTCDENE